MQRTAHKRYALRRPCALALLSAILCMFGSIPASAAELEIPMLPELDWFGDQIETLQIYESDGVQRAAFGIYDTGASVATLSAADQEAFLIQGSPVPIKIPGGAVANAVDGTVVGDISMPVTFWADGIHAVTFDWSGLELSADYDLSGGVEVPGVQVFVGTYDGSAQLPNIAGTPIHHGKLAPEHSGSAARVDMQGYSLDLGELFADDPFLGPLLEDIVYYVPDLTFVEPGYRLTPVVGEMTDAIRISLSMFGPDNHPNPGDELTIAPNPVQEHVFVSDAGNELSDRTFLFDTGATVSVITTETAVALGIDLDSPETTIDVVGAAGSPVTVPGFTIDVLEIPYDSDFDGIDDSTLRYTDVPVFVIDFSEGLDGILGMNLLNPAAEFVYDPWDPLGPSLQTTFFTAERLPPDSEDETLFQLIAETNSLLGDLMGVGGAGTGLPRFELTAIPEPHTATLAVLACVAGLGLVQLRRRHDRDSGGKK